MKGIIEKRESNINLSEQTDDTHLFVISDRSWDSHNSSFDLAGWNLEQYRNNPIVTYGHPEFNSTDESLIIGKADVFIQDDKLMGRITYDMENPKAVNIKSKVERGFLNMASIRAFVTAGEKVKREDIGKTGIKFTAQRLIDFGIVMHGSNANATKRDILEIARSLDIDMEDTDMPDIYTDTTTDEDLGSADNAAFLEEARLLIQNSNNNIKKVVK